ncbi:MAG: CaiB/BaiF CoA transferase family protein [Hyphomicrobiales bacterium]
MSSALNGIRVLDFGRYIAGPWCAALLGDFGADVIRVDKIGGSEDREPMPVGDGADGAIFLQVNRNKRGMTLDTRHSDGEAVLNRLVETADVVVANLPETALEALGLDYDSLTAIKPDIILTSVTAFGTLGPNSHKVGFDVMGQAMSGAMAMTGPEQDPMRSYVSWVDFSTATLAAFGTLSAIIERDRTGKGQRVEGSLLATALATTGPHLIEQAMTQVGRTRSANRSQVCGPSDMFRTADGEIVVQVIGQPMFVRWTRLIGDQGLLDDPRFADDETRAVHGVALSDLMQAWCDGRTTEQALALLEQARIPAAPVLGLQQALDDPHVAAAGMFQPPEAPGLATPVPVSATPVRLSATPGTVRTVAPGIGEHTDEILAALGYDAAEIASLRACGAV